MRDRIGAGKDDEQYAGESECGPPSTDTDATGDECVAATMPHAN